VPGLANDRRTIVESLHDWGFVGLDRLGERAMVRAMKLPMLAPLALVLALVPACKKASYDFETNSPATAGMAEIVMKVDKTGNGAMSLKFEHLAPPKKVDSSLSAYVVWMQVDGKDPAKLGVLEYNAKKRSGSLDATYSAGQMKIIVTLEQDPSTTAPIGARVLDVDVSGPKG